jgi:transcriptional regulator with XRE-family HTH domain
MQIGENIRIARTRLGYSQEYVAEILQISKQRYRQLENEDQDSLTWGRLCKIAEILKIDILNLVNLHNMIGVGSFGEITSPNEINALKELVQIQKELLNTLRSKSNN